MADINGALKTLGSGIVGSIPNVGAFAAAVFTLLWPDTPTDYWGEVKEKVFAEIEKAVNGAKVQQLRDLLEGTKANFQEYVQTTDPAEKKSRCVSVDVAFTQIKNQFMDDSLDSAVYFVQFAALHIAINVDLVLHYNDAKNRQDMKNLVDEYSAYARKMSPRLVQFRLGEIDTKCLFDVEDPLVIEHSTKETIGSAPGITVKVTSYGIAKDNHLKAKVLVLAAFMTSTSIYGSGPSRIETTGGKEKCARQLGEYRAKIKQETEAYWTKNLIDPIDVYKNAKVLAS